MYSYKTKGKFFDYDCDCYLEFDGNKVFTSFSLYVYDDNLIERLNDVYSGLISSNMMPYVASNGGAVYRK